MNAVMRQIPPLSAVKVFEAAARHENFTRAADELGMTQAAVSYQIRLLEERLGAALFVRDRRRVKLSDAGRKIAPHVTNGLDMIATGFAELASDSDGVLGISTSQTFASHWLAPRLGTFQMRQPELAVRLKVDNRVIDFAGDDADLAIRTGKGGWPGLRQHFLFHFHSMPMCSADFLERHGFAGPADLLKAPRISAGDPAWRHWLEKAGIFEPEGAHAAGLWSDSQVIEGNSAMAGHGIAMLSPIFWRSELASGKLVAPFPMVSLDGFSLWLVYPEHKRNQPKIRAFRDWLVEQIAVDAMSGPPEVYAPPEDAASA
jgi:LysR family glycine cleavage system transcriptional activator